jgi:cytochrome c biogenesis protein CcdA/thiol-disulfide isomerase/thioredoxin
MAFAFVAGAGTAITPCVLPVLPALLSAGATGGRRRPLGVVLGLTTTFTIVIVGAASVVDGVGLGDGALRDVAVVVLVGFGVSLLSPRITAAIEAPLSRLARFGPRKQGDGFVGGLGIGAALGFVYAPCAGPILAAVISVSAASGETIAVAVAYSLGSAVVLLALTLGGRRLFARAPRQALMPVLGVVMIATAVLIATDVDVRFQTALANHFPSVLVNPTRDLEKSAAVEKRLEKLRGRARFAAHAQAAPMPKHSLLPVLGTAPDFVGNQRWFNTPGGKALTLAQLRGRVVLVDFWTYTCINCIRTLPYVRAWDERYRSDGLTIVGVHTPEFAFEKDAGNVEDAIEQNHLRYPVAQDNDYATWNAWGNNSWPAKYLIDAKGQVRYAHIGEGEYDVTEDAIRDLLAEARARKLPEQHAEVGRTEEPGLESSPETYLGAARAERFLPSAPTAGAHDYAGVPAANLPQSHFALGGRWRITKEAATAISGATLNARVVGQGVYLVLSPGASGSGRVTVELDGKPIRSEDAGSDVHDGVVEVKRQRLYRLVQLDQTEEHTLTLRFAPGTAGYAFTFG